MAKKIWENQEVADLLRAVAAAYEIKGANRFRVAAYRQAATSIEHLTSEIQDLWENNQITQIPGVGASIARHLNELMKTGKSQHFQKVLAGIPPAVFELLKITGIGPKTAFRLCQALKIWSKKDALQRVANAAKRGKIRQLSGFGAQSENKILEAIANSRLKKKERRRMLLALADNLAKDVEKYLRQSPLVLEVKVLGSLRRRCATVGDLDMAVKTRHYKQALEYFLNFPKVKKILNQGEKKTSVVLSNGVQIDVRFQAPDTWGSMLQYFTGSKQHNIHLREMEREKGFSLSEYGIRSLKTKKLVKTRTERIFYNFLGLDYIPPELREDQGEIEAAINHTLPKLVKRADIRGDLHLHSNFPIETSHDLGKDNFSTMIKKAASLGYEYLGFSEHNPSQRGHTPDDVFALLKEKRHEIDQINRQLSQKLHVIALNSLEIDIKPNGELAIPEKALELLDYAIIAVHSEFTLSSKRMTTRILRALKYPKVRILAHPTGRKIYQRDGYDVDWNKIFAFCREHNIALEINSWPERLDLPDILVREAVEADVPLVIDTDSHAVEHMDLMEYGLDVARRGWAEKKNIINTLPLRKLEKLWNLNRCARRDSNPRPSA